MNVIRYNDVNKMNVVTLQLKTKNFLCKVHKFRKKNKTILYQHLFKAMMKNCLKNVEKCGIRLLN